MSLDNWSLEWTDSRCGGGPSVPTSTYLGLCRKGIVSRIGAKDNGDADAKTEAKA